MNATAWHPSDDDLTMAIAVAPEASESPSGRIGDHLARCESCRERYDEIAAVVTLARDASTPDPGEDFDARMWARIQPALTRPAAWSARQLVPVLAWAAAVGGIVVGGYFSAAHLPQSKTPAVPPATPAAAEIQNRVLLAAVDSHLSETEMLFVELLNDRTASPGVVSFARETANDLIWSGRLYRETARQIGDMPVAIVLDDIEPVLIEVARSAGGISASDLAVVRSRIEEDDLLFKVRAVTQDIRARQEQPMSNEGAL